MDESCDGVAEQIVLWLRVCEYVLDTTRMQANGFSLLLYVKSVYLYGFTPKSSDNT